jgi:hypothetical protein
MPHVQTAEPVKSQSVKLIGMLESVRRVIDEKFLAACELLSQAIDGIEHLIESLDRLAETLDEKIVTATTADLKVAAEKLFALPENHNCRIMQVGRLSRSREDFSERVSDMRCSLAYMRAFVSGVKNDAGEAKDERFTTFVHEIAACVERGTEALKKLEFDLASLQLDLETSTAKGDILEFQIDQLLPMVPDDLTTNAKIMGNHYLRVASTAGSVASLARDIHMRVSRILSALQIGDITRQRVEHIQAGVILLDTTGRMIVGEQREQIMSSLYTLLASQVSAASTDFHREVSEINQSMAAMAADARELLKLHDMAYGGSVGAEGGFLRKSGDQIERALDLVDEVEDTERQTIDTGRNTAAAAHELCSRLEALQNLKDGIRLAVEKAGAPIVASSVVANELGEYVELLQRATGDSMLIAGELEKTAAALVRNWETTGGEQSESAAATAALRVAAGRIRNARDKTEVDISSIVSKGDAVMSMLELSSSRLDFHVAIGEILDAVTADLSRLGKRASPCSNDNTVQLEAMLNRMAKFYSMAQERDVHRSFVTALGVRMSEPEPSQFGDDDFETVLF